MNRLMFLLATCLFASLFFSGKTLAQTDAEQESTPAEAAPASASSAKPMIREANINLQTTVTGNQEQPRVMYILPWQSPLSPDLEMEMLSSQEDAIFGHIERDEMQRNLEAFGELDQVDE
jgi:hypothetical protein